MNMRKKDIVQSDIKQAMLTGDKAKTAVLQSVKSAFLDFEVEHNKREEGLSDDDAIRVLVKELKKRQESANAFRRGGEIKRAEAEEYEKAIIEAYVPTSLSDEELGALIDTEIGRLDAPTMKDMGRIIAEVKKTVGPTADGAVIASKVKKALSE